MGILTDTEWEKLEEELVMKKEYKWLIEEHVKTILISIKNILTEACRKFTVFPIEGETSLVKPEKFVFTGSSNAGQPIKCIVTLLADLICEAEITIKMNKPHSSPVTTKIYPDVPWKLQQIQDAGNYLLQALNELQMHDDQDNFENGDQVVALLENILINLNRGRICLALPVKKTIEQLKKNPLMNSFKPPLPSDTLVSFYVQAQKIVISAYHVNVTKSTCEVNDRAQMECPVPWLNEVLAQFRLALQQCQQLLDQVLLFGNFSSISTKDIMESNKHNESDMTFL